MKKRKMNFAQTFIIVALVLMFIVSGVVVYGVYDYYHPDVINNRPTGQIYDKEFKIALEDTWKEDYDWEMFDLFADNFDPIIAEDLDHKSIHVYMSNPQKDVEATENYESYMIIQNYDNVLYNYEQFGLTKEDVRGYNNKEYYDSEEYFEENPLGANLETLGTYYPISDSTVKASELENMYANMMGIEYFVSYFKDTSLYSKKDAISTDAFSFVSYSAYSKRMDRYELGDQLFSGTKNVVTELGEIEVDGIKVELAISEREAGIKEQLAQDKEQYILNTKANMINGKTEYEVLREAFGRPIEEVYEDIVDDGNEMLLTLVRGRFRVDGVYYEIVYSLMNRWYDTESGNVGSTSTDFAKLQAVAQKSMAHMVSNFVD